MRHLLDAPLHVVVCGGAGLKQEVVVACVETSGARADLYAVVEHRAAACCEAAGVGDGRLLWGAEGAV